MNNSKIRQTLLYEKNLTWTKALEVAQGMETTAKNDKALTDMGEAVNSERVHRVASRDGRKGKSSTRQSFTGTCFCCDKVGHKQALCHFKDEACHS